MAYQLEDLLKGLDEPTIKQVKEVISKTTKELDAKLFIDGDGQHFVPHARFDEVVKQRDDANGHISEYQKQVEELSKQVKDDGDAQTTIQTLQKQLSQQAEIAKGAAVTSALYPLISDSIAPAADLLGFMNLDNITVEADGKVKGLEDELKAVRESRKYLFKEVEVPEDPQPEASGRAKAGTGNVGNSGRVGSGVPEPREVGSFGKQLAAAQQPAGAQEQQSSFFK